MKQVFYNYIVWEDFRHGMYDENKDGRESRVQKAVEILCNLDLLYSQMKRVTVEWKYCTEQNFTNPAINHQAFLGQTACNIYAYIKEDETREAWGRLTNEQRHQANRVADRVFAEWIKEYTKDEIGYQLSMFE